MRKHSSLLLTLAMGLSACMPDSLTKYRETPVVPTAVATTAPGVTNFTTLSYFQVTNTTAGDKYSLFRDNASLGSMSLDCSIEKSVITGVADDINNNPTTSNGIIYTNADVNCYLNAEELELYTKGLKLKLQVPAGICQYISYDHYSFFKHQYKVSNPALQVVTNYTYQLATGSTCTLPTAPTTLTAPKCIGDYSGGNPAGPNCDTGSVRVNTITRTYSGGGTGTCTTSSDSAPVAADTECGGKIGNCLAGPAVDHQDINADYAWPRLMIVEAYDGFEKEWEFKSPISQSHSTNLYIANYTNKCSAASDSNSLTNRYADEVSGTCLNGTTIVPGLSLLQCEAQNYTWKPFNHNLSLYSQAYSKLSGAGSSDFYYDPMKGANPFYTYSCLDENFELIGRIRVLVRDWNVRFSKTADQTLLVKTNDATKMDKDGTEPGGSTPYNDFKDWDDMLESTGTCSTSTYTTEAKCTAAGAKWLLNNQGICHVAGFTTSGTCTAGGLCSDGASTTSGACTGIWTANTWDSGTSHCINTAATSSTCAAGTAGGTPTWAYTSCVDTSTTTPDAFSKANCETTVGRFWTGSNCVWKSISTPTACTGTKVWSHGCQAGVAPLFKFPGFGL